MRSKKAVKNILVSLLQQVVIVICGLIMPRAIIGKYGSNVNGLVSSISQFLAYITLLEAGIGPVIKSALYKPIAQKNKEQIGKILKSTQSFFRVISGIFLIYIIILCTIYPIIVANEFETGYTISLILIIAISTFVQYFFGMVYNLYIQAEQKTYITASIQMSTTILNTILVVTLIKFGASIQVVKLGSAGIFVLRPFLLNIYVRKKHEINLKNVQDKYDLKQRWDGLVQHIASVVHNNTDVAVLTIFVGTAEVSVYAVYALVISAIKNLVQAIKDGVDASFGDMIAKNEIENLNRSFKIYELFYFTLVTLVYSITMIMIVPFVKVYTMGITDVNYNRPLFSIFIVLAELMWALRLPYSGITLSAGHFKETRKGAVIEVVTNIVLSIILVLKFRIVGVAIGTLVAMTLRTIEFMYHSSKYILKRNLRENIKRVLITTVEIIILIPLGFYLSNFFVINSYINWMLNAVVVTILAVIIIVPINLIVYKSDVKGLLKIIKVLRKGN